MTALKNTWALGESYAHTDQNAVATAVNVLTLTPTAIKTTTYAAAANELVLCDNSASGFTVTLPSAPITATMVAVKTSSAAFTITVARGGTDTFNVSGGSTTQTLTMQNQVSTWVYYSGIWYQLSQAIAVGQMDLRYYPIGGAAALGTPTSGTLTSCTGLPVAGGGTGASTAAGAVSNLAIPADFILVQLGNNARTTGSGDFTVAHYVGRAFTATKVVYQFDTADASGSTTVELRRNGAQVTSSSVAVSAANQADGTGTDAARTVTISQSFAVGDRINLQTTAVGTTPGKGLRAWVVGTWN